MESVKKRLQKALCQPLKTVFLPDRHEIQENIVI